MKIDVCLEKAFKDSYPKDIYPKDIYLYPLGCFFCVEKKGLPVKDKIVNGIKRSVKGRK